MRTITIGGEQRKAVFTTWTAAEFHRMTGVNLYDPKAISNVFQKYEDDEQPTPSEFENISKLAYCVLASAEMPEDAADDWKPGFTWKGISNKIPINDGTIYSELVAVYFDKDMSDLIEMIKDNQSEESKNALAPTEGQ